MTSALFSPLTLRGLTLKNRIVVSPMCQYSADNGIASDWHMQHLGGLSMSGAGLVISEATAVTPEGRISPRCLGLWSDTHAAAIGRVIAAIRKFGVASFGMQLAHAGRKGSAQVPWLGRSYLRPEEGAWRTVAPSPLPFDDGWPTPTELSVADMMLVVECFVQAVRRAAAIGVDLIEVHGAHGYLVHEFMSPITNKRTDAYGGSLRNRMRFALELFGAMRAAWPQDKPMGMRITGSDFIAGGLTVEDAVALTRELKAIGCDYVCVSGGGASMKGLKIPLGPGYQVPFAARVREATGITTMAVGMIYDPHQAEAILREGKADAVAIARAFLDNPRWPWHAAAALGAEAAYPPQYRRAGAPLWPGFAAVHGEAAKSRVG